MIVAGQLVYDYPGQRALDQVTFSLAATSITALVGPNGAGKTTLLRCIAGLDEPYSGSIEVAGIDVLRQPRDAHRQIGYQRILSLIYECSQNRSAANSLVDKIVNRLQAEQLTGTTKSKASSSKKKKQRRD